MSDTHRTDAEIARINYDTQVMEGYELARQFERELLARLQSRDFYELCQEYRHYPIDAADQFQALKDYILTGKLPWPSYEEKEELSFNVWLK